MEIQFKNIDWPEGIRWRSRDEEPPAIAHSAHSPPVPSGAQAPQVLSSAPNVDVPASAVSTVGTVCNALLFDIAPFVPDRRGQSDRLLWAMAGRLKTVEKKLQRHATSEEKAALIKAWWPLAEPYVDPAFDRVAYHAKWLADYKNRKWADDENAITAAWTAAQAESAPVEATVDYDGNPMPEKMQLLVALCYQLQLHCGEAAFYLGSRDAGKLLSMPHRTVAFWLDILAADDGPYRILKKMRIGSFAERLTNEYLYLPLVSLPAEETSNGAA
ncbi:MAG: hypothetical protein WDN28_30420 [Chthoniobacter sp.]